MFGSSGVVTVGEVAVVVVVVVVAGAPVDFASREVDLVKAASRSERN